MNSESEAYRNLHRMVTGEFTTEELQALALEAIETGKSMDQLIGVRKSCRTDYMVAARNRLLRQGSRLAGSPEKFLETYSRWMVGHRFSVDLELICGYLRLVEADGFPPPGKRQLQRIAGDTSRHVNVTPFERRRA